MNNLETQGQRMVMKGDTQRLRELLRDRLQTGARIGQTGVEINAGRLHREFGGYPAPKGNHSMPAVSTVMWEEFSTARGDREVYSPPKKKAALIDARVCSS